MEARSTRAGASKSSTSISNLSNTDAHNGHIEKKAEDTDMDIYGLPLSSDEEEEKKPTLSASPSPRPTKVARRPKLSPPRPIISLSTGSVKKATFAAVPDLDELFLSSQPKKKRKVDYAARNIHIARHDIEEEGNSEVNFVAPAALELDEGGIPATRFKAPPAVTELNRRRNKNAPKSAVFKPPPSSATTETASTGPKFKMPTALEDPDSSAPSQTETTFDIPEASQADSRKRSGSTSSLSSHSSIELRMTLKEQRELAYDDTGDGLQDKLCDRCDICDRRVERAEFRELCAKYKGTGIRRRYKICAAHKKRKAERTWTEKGYPTIDWQYLESDGVARHIPHLNDILHRKSPSFYRTKLDVAEQDGRKALHSYLKAGVIDVAKQGYYGPRGASVMGHAITTMIERDLAAQMKTDRVVRAAGFGGYVSAVLVPELMIELVKEDMRVTTSEEARKILEQSTEDGALINGDDEEVVHRAEDDD